MESSTVVGTGYRYPTVCGRKETCDELSQVDISDLVGDAEATECRIVRILSSTDNEYLFNTRVSLWFEFLETWDFPCLLPITCWPTRTLFLGMKHKGTATIYTGYSVHWLPVRTGTGTVRTVRYRIL